MARQQEFQAQQDWAQKQLATLEKQADKQDTTNATLAVGKSWHRDLPISSRARWRLPW